jgi:CheY-like chemotaxis protein
MPSTPPSPQDLVPVLLVEDDEVHARIIEATLAKARLSNPVVRARTGDEAIAYLEEVEDGRTRALPVLVLLDLELPGRSGLAVLAKLRALGREAEDCPVIMMSGSSNDATIARARELGVRGYLVKPVAFDALIDVIHRLGLRWALLPGCGQ